MMIDRKIITTKFRSTPVSFTKTLLKTLGEYPKHFSTANSFLSIIQKYYGDNTSCSTVFQRLQMHIVNPKKDSKDEPSLKVDESVLSSLNQVSKYFISFGINPNTKIGNDKSAEIKHNVYFFCNGLWQKGFKESENKFTKLTAIKIDDQLPYNFFTGVLAKLSTFDQQLNQVMNNVNSILNQLMQSRVNTMRLVNDYTQGIDKLQKSLYRSHI